MFLLSAADFYLTSRVGRHESPFWAYTAFCGAKNTLAKVNTWSGTRLLRIPCVSPQPAVTGADIELPAVVNAGAATRHYEVEFFTVGVAMFGNCGSGLHFIETESFERHTVHR